MIGRSKLLKIASKLVKQSLDSDGNLLEARVNKILSVFSRFSRTEQLVLLKAFGQALSKRQESRVMNLESVIELDSEAKQSIEKKIAFSRPVHSVGTKINPDLIGGIRVSIDDLVFDTSLKTKMSNLAKGLG